MLSPSFGKVVYIKIISLKPRQNKENKNNPSKRTGCFYGGDGGISARFAHWIASAKPKILHLLLGFLGRQVLTRWVLIRTKIEKELPKGNSFSMAEMVGFPLASLTGLLPPSQKSFAFGLNFGASGTHPVGSHPHQNRKRAPKRELFFYGGDGGIRTHVPG